MTQARTFLAWTLLLTACSADEAPSAPANANAGGDGATPAAVRPSQPGETLCSRARDPEGLFCDQATPRLSAAEAYALARSAVPEGRFYYLMSGNRGTLNVDGRDTSWLLLFHDDRRHETTAVALDEGKVSDVSQRTDDPPSDCDTEGDMQVLNSQAVVHDALARLEPKLGTFVHGHGSLFLRQQACPYHSDDQELDYVAVLVNRRDELDPTYDEFYHLRYRDGSRFVEERDACDSVDFDSCTD